MAMNTNKIIPARFFQIPGSDNSLPVRDWILTLTDKERWQIGHDIHTIECGWPIGMPVCHPLGDELFEVRSNLENRIARIIFCIADGNMWLLHGFIKTTQKIPTQDMRIAKQRKNILYMTK